MSTEGNPNPNQTTPTPPPSEPPAAPPEAKAAEKKLLDELKQAKAKAKELEAKLSEAMPYVEKFRGHEEAKALEAQRRTEADAIEARKREARERAIRDEVLYGLTSSGRKIERKGVALILAGALSPEAGIALDDDGKVTGVDEYLSSVFTTFGETPEVPPKKPAPGLPDAKGQPQQVGGKYDHLKTFKELVDLGPLAVEECYEKHRATYDRLKSGQATGLRVPTRVMFGAAPTLRSS